MANSSPRFNVGDKVIAVDPDYSLYGFTGTVVSVNYEIPRKFDYMYTVDFRPKGIVSLAFEYRLDFADENLDQIDISFDSFIEVLSCHVEQRSTTREIL